MDQPSTRGPAQWHGGLPLRELRGILPPRQKTRRGTRRADATRASVPTADSGAPGRAGGHQRRTAALIAKDPVLQQILSDVGLSGDVKAARSSARAGAFHPHTRLQDRPQPSPAPARGARRAAVQGRGGDRREVAHGLEVLLRAHGMTLKGYRRMDRMYASAERSARAASLGALHRIEDGSCADGIGCCGDYLGAAECGAALRDVAHEHGLAEVGVHALARSPQDDERPRHFTRRLAGDWRRWDMVRQLLSEREAAHRHRPAASRAASAPKQAGASSRLAAQAARGATALAPVRATAASTPSSRARPELVARSFDATLSRTAPAILEPGAEHSVEELRRELEVSRRGFRALNSLVRADARWVHAHVPGARERLRGPGRAVCRQWAAERVAAILQAMEARRALAAWRRWSHGAAIDKALEDVNRHLRVKGEQLLAHRLRCWVDTVLRAHWERWARTVAEILQGERADAAVKVGRVGRGFLGRRRAARRKKEKASTLLQAAARGRLARREASRRRQERRVQGAASAVQRQWRRHAERKNARMELARRRALRAALRLQRSMLGYRARQECRRRRRDRQRQRHARDIQCLWRGQRARVEASRRRQARDAAAAVKLQSVQRGRAARRRVREERVKRARIAAAARLEREVLRRAARNVALARQRTAQERGAATAIQALHRRRIAGRRADSLRRARRRSQERRAAVVIQSASRQHLARRETEGRRSVRIHAERGAAAARLQAAYRGRLGRKDLARRRQRRQDLRQRAAVAIQSKERQRRARRRARRARRTRALEGRAARTIARALRACQARRAARERAERRDAELAGLTTRAQGVAPETVSAADDVRGSAPAPKAAAPAEPHAAQESRQPSTRAAAATAKAEARRTTERAAAEEDATCAVERQRPVGSAAEAPRAALEGWARAAPRAVLAEGAAVQRGVEETVQRCVEEAVRAQVACVERAKAEMASQLTVVQEISKASQALQAQLAEARREADALREASTAAAAAAAAATATAAASGRPASPASAELRTPQADGAAEGSSTPSPAGAGGGGGGCGGHVAALVSAKLRELGEMEQRLKERERFVLDAEERAARAEKEAAERMRAAEGAAKEAAAAAEQVSESLHESQQLIRLASAATAASERSAPAPQGPQGAASLKVGGGASAGGAAASAGPWQRYFDSRVGSYYWYNAETGEASWTLPSGERGAAAGDLESTTGASQEDAWTEYLDSASGSKYWYNAATREASWADPAAGASGIPRGEAGAPADAA